MKLPPSLQDTKIFAIRPGEAAAELVASCDCGRKESLRYQQRMPPTFYAQALNNKGWSVDNKCTKAACPKCVGAKSMTAKTSPAALKSQAKMFAMLSEFFDAETGQYADGWSDARIARDVGMAESYVAEAREAAHGPLREHPAIEQAKADLAALRSKTDRDIVEMSPDAGPDGPGLRARGGRGPAADREGQLHRAQGRLR